MTDTVTRRHHHRHDHADHGGRPTHQGIPPMPPVTWDHRRHPTPAEWIEWLAPMSDRQREYAVGNLLEHAQAGVRCLTELHDARLGEDTLTAAKIAVQAHLDDPGTPRCPCCGQVTKRYRRQINSQMARALIVMFRETHKWEQLGVLDGSPTAGAACADDPVLTERGKLYLHLPTLLGRTADEAKLAYWKLIDPLPATRGDGSTRTGWWTLTELGRLYVKNLHAVPRYALVFDGKVNGFEGPKVDISDALGTRFDYDDLMAGA